MKGLVLAGGNGTRLRPVTLGVSKQLLPVYNKPLIFYPISTLMLSGIREIGIICNPRDLSAYQNLFGNGSRLGLKIAYFVQNKPEGIAQAFIIAKNFIKGEKVALILGDNIFYGKGLGRQLAGMNNVSGANIFAHQVKNPGEFGVLEFDSEMNVVSIEEKPKIPKSNFVIPGLYFYDETVTEFATKLEPSMRGEFEITDLNNMYLKIDKLKVTKLERGTAWFDTGTFDSLHDASTFIRITEGSQSEYIGCLEEISYSQRWINRNQLEEIISNETNLELSRYLKNLI
jgi:glucose-1-phosphate thymidylyltransferase